HRTRWSQRPDRFSPERHALYRRADEMVPPFDRRRRGHARGNFARLPRFTWLHSTIRRRRKIILRQCEGRHAGGCGRLLKQGTTDWTAVRNITAGKPSLLD